MKICVFCAKEFEPTTNKQVCCSKLCNVKKWRKENPEKSKLGLEPITVIGCKVSISFTKQLDKYLDGGISCKPI